MAKAPRAVVLLGAQRFDPTLGEAVKDLGIKGRIATITAGWQEREEEDDDLEEHLAPLGITTENLRLRAMTACIVPSTPPPTITTRCSVTDDEYNLYSQLWAMALCAMTGRRTSGTVR